MGTIAKRSFIQKYAAKVQFDAKNKPPRTQRKTFCRLCGKSTNGGHYCKACEDNPLRQYGKMKGHVK